MEVHFTPEIEQKLKALAAQTGQGAERLVEEIVAGEVESRLHSAAASPAPNRRHISAVIAEIMADVPLEVMASLPKDGASQHDHYIYGWPKRDQ